MNGKWMRAFVAMAMASAVTFCVVGCEERGPAEKAGRSLDKAADDLKDAGHDLKHDLKRDLSDDKK